MASNSSHHDALLTAEKVINLLGSMPLMPLPEGWIGVNHKSGGIVYLHKKTRVVTWSRPYFIGTASLRKHNVPTAAIPCLHQHLGLQKCRDKDCIDVELPPNKQKKSADVFDAMVDVISNSDLARKTSVDVFINEALTDAGQNADQTESEGCQNEMHRCEMTNSCTTIGSKTELNLSLGNCSYPKESSGYCPSSSRIFGRKRQSHICEPITPECHTQMITDKHLEVVFPDQLESYLSKIFPFKTLTEEESKRPIFGEGSYKEPEVELPKELQNIPFISLKKSKDGESFVITPGKSHLSMLNEYCNKILKKSVQWIDGIAAGDNFVVESVIEGIKYGTGEGRSKKAAKQLAAKHTLEILIPQQITEISNFVFSQEQLAVFDQLCITDPKVADCTRSVGLPLPADVLSTCLKRNRGLCDTNVCFNLHRSETDEIHTYEIACGKHTVTGTCKSRRVGKQLGSQEMLQKIHPKLEKWGQLIRLYCNSPKGLIREPKNFDFIEHPKLPESKAELMVRLRNEMRDLERRRDTRRAEGSSSTAVHANIVAKDLDF